MKLIRNLAGVVVGASVLTYWAWTQALSKLDSMVMPVLTEEKRRESLADVPPSMWHEGDILRYKAGDSTNTLIFIDHAAYDSDLFLGEWEGGFGYFSKEKFVLHELNEETRGV